MMTQMGLSAVSWEVTNSIFCLYRHLWFMLYVLIRLPFALLFWTLDLTYRCLQLFLIIHTPLHNLHSSPVCSVLRWWTGKVPRPSMSSLPRTLMGMRCLLRNTGKAVYFKRVICFISILSLTSCLLHVFFFLLWQRECVYHCKCGLQMRKDQSKLHSASGNARLLRWERFTHPGLPLQPVWRTGNVDKQQ